MTVQKETTRACEEKRGARGTLARRAAARTSLRRRFALFGLMAAMFAGVAVSGRGAETNSAPAKAGDEASQAEREPRSRLDWLTNPDRWDARHDFVSAGVIGAVERIDRIFGDERLDDDTRLSRLHVKVGGQYSEQDEFSLLTNFRLRLALPRLQNRLQLIVNDEIEAEDAESSDDLAEAAEDSKADVALRYIASGNVRHRLSVDAGVRGFDPLQGLGRTRGWVAVPVGPWEMRLTETVTWLTRDGFASTTEMRWTRPLRHQWWLRSTSRLTWEEQLHGVTPAQSLAVGRTPTDRRAYRLESAGSWPETPHTDSARYRLTFTYRQALHRNWLFLEIAPGVDFRQNRDYEPNPGIALHLELILGDVR
jgi:hypothetical protein